MAFWAEASQGIVLGAGTPFLHRKDAAGTSEEQTYQLIDCYEL